MSEPEGLPQVASDLARASRVVVVPGFGLAAAQAHTPLLLLDQLLRARGVAVDYAIHPLAGRFPGQLNALLTAVGRDRQHAAGELDLADADVLLAVGANDVINASAAADRTSALFGLGAFDLSVGKRVVILKRSPAPGFSGVDNPLLDQGRQRRNRRDRQITLLLGELAPTLTALVVAVSRAPQA